MGDLLQKVGHHSVTSLEDKLDDMETPVIDKSVEEVEDQARFAHFQELKLVNIVSTMIKTVATYDMIK